MKICFDLRALQIGHENRGIGMYIKSVLENIEDTENTYIFYAFDNSNPIEKLGIDFSGSYELVQTEKLKTAVNSPADIFALIKLTGHRFKQLRSYKPDVFVQFDFNLGIPRFRKTKTVAIAYDLIPLLMKNEYLPSVRFAWNHSAGKKAKLRAITRSIYYRIKYKIHYRVFKRADALVAISEATRQSFIDLLGIKPNKITSIPLAPVLPQTKPDMKLAEAVGKPYIMYVGGTDSRKRLVDIVRAFNIVRGRGQDIALVLAGNEFKTVDKIPDIEGRNAIMNSPYQDDIKLLGFIDDAQKLGLYKNAHAFVFCTVFEGFGLPVIEAMSVGCPVISYNNSSIPEAAGNAARLVETGNYVAVAEEIIALGDENVRSKLIELGYKQAKKFSWEKYTTAFLEKITFNAP